MRALHRWMLAGVIAATACGAAAVEAQAFDSLGRPRPLRYPERPPVTRDSTRICLDCDRTNSRFVKEPAWRIIGADGQVLYMSSVDTASGVMTTADGITTTLESSHVVSIEISRAGAAEKSYGKAYSSGVIVVTLDQKGTEAWLRDASARAAKPAAAAPQRR
jgi:hypothetical protein